jgi:hypothetical protein
MVRRLHNGNYVGMFRPVEKPPAAARANRWKAGRRISHEAYNEEPSFTVQLLFGHRTKFCENCSDGAGLPASFLWALLSSAALLLFGARSLGGAPAVSGRQTTESPAPDPGDSASGRIGRFGPGSKSESQRGPAGVKLGTGDP